MPDYTIDINLNSVSSKRGDTKDRASGDSQSRKSPAAPASREEAVNNLWNIDHPNFNEDDLSAEVSEDRSAQAAKRLSSMSKLAKSSIGIAGLGTTIIHGVKTFALDNISEKYGDQARQNTVNNALTIVGYESSIASSVAVGAAVGRGVGAAVGAVLGVVNLVIDSIEREMKWQRQEQENLYTSVRASERLGVDISQRSRSR
jgi:hypothetical protein